MLYHATENEGYGQQEITLNTQTRQLCRHPDVLHNGRIIRLTADRAEYWKHRLTENPTGWKGVPTYDNGTPLYPSENAYWEEITKGITLYQELPMQGTARPSPHTLYTYPPGAPAGTEGILAEGTLKG